MTPSLRHAPAGTNQPIAHGLEYEPWGERRRNARAAPLDRTP